ncbi:hypothetical protein DDZ13_01395 [Coraliomargarita sinensis]|uniref:Methyltransferase FkbM domain-containing protein n=1 Tax=Coraliomargarita sinensis TaxID=2174842 RepID=A0A317ZIW3_9BACT|nr:FkbM family methyltransferase [Coraliomargarita sinensis]PXA05555.1 hypothetical protein DDZ13_01395 [Coraliomargarita sinensis]
MILQTKHKIFLASLVYHPNRWLRTILGKTDLGQFSRNGFKWELDLSEVVDFSIYLTGGFERYLNKFIESNLSNGMIALDIGANIGAHTLTMGRSIAPEGQAHAIEATEYAFRKLSQNIKLNPRISDHVIAHHCMLMPSSDQDIESNTPNEIHSSWPFHSRQSRHQSHQGVLKSIGTARKISLDCLCAELDLKRLDLMKIDVDGNEWDVLSGGLETLERFSPVIVMEVAPDYHQTGATKSFPNIHRLLTDLGYCFFHLDGKRLPTTAEALGNSVPDGASMNVVASHPNSRPLSFSHRPCF